MSADITDANTFEIISATGTEDTEDNDSPTLWGGPTGAGSLGNPELTEDIFELNIILRRSFSMSIEILTSKVPMEGDFYAKDGNAGGGTNFFWADDVIPVPNTSEVTIPGAIFLLGSGLIGFVGMRNRFNK